MELQVTNSPFNQEQAELLNRLLPTLTETQRIWLSGYLAALQGSVDISAAAPGLPSSDFGSAMRRFSKEVTVSSVHRLGIARVGEKLSRKLEEQGFQVTLSSMSDFKPNNLKKFITC